ncbi:MAG: hypothetical protein ABJP70_06350 [Erythrobacter sp.]
MQFPNLLQSVLLFDAPIDILEAAVRDFARVEEMKTGAIFGVPETRPGRFYRLANADAQLMLTAEYVHGPANTATFKNALGSAITGLLTPDIRDRITKTRSHIILEVSQTAQGENETNDEAARDPDDEAKSPESDAQDQFHRRLDLLALFSRIVTDHAKPLAVHWTQSDMLLTSEKFDELAAIDAPGPLHIHPFLFGPSAKSDEPKHVGIRTFGARHWLGREVVVDPNILPWTANFETILAFLRLASLPNGYLIPDGDTFGPEDGSASTRVSYRDAGANEGGASLEKDTSASYELTPLKHDAYGFVAADYSSPANPVNDAITSAVSLAKDHIGPAMLEAGFRDTRKMVEAFGGSLDNGATNESSAASDIDEAPQGSPPSSAPPAIIAPTPSQPGLPTISGQGLRAKVFGRKQT